MLKWTCHLISTYPYWEGPQHIFLTIVRNKLEKGTPASLKCPVIALLYRLDLTMRTGHQIRELKCNESKWTPRQHESSGSPQLPKSRCGYHNGQQSRSSHQNGLIYIDIWHWLVNQCSQQRRTEIDGKSIKFSLYL